MTDALPRAYRFHGFRLDLAQRRLAGPDGTGLTLSGRAYDVLLFLVANRARVVSKDELLKAVWPRSVVEENNLNQAVSILRRALGDSREEPRFVATIAGRGYQFVAEVTEERPSPSAGALLAPAAAAVTGASTAAGVAGAPAATAADTPPLAANPTLTSPLPGSPAVPTITRRWALTGLAALGAGAVGLALWRQRPGDGSSLPSSIAVLPFKPLVTGSGNEAMELGITESLINRLSELPGVIVSPLSSVRRYASIDDNPLAAGRELDVSAVVDGHMQIQGDRIRLTARLLAVADGKALWTGSFNERLDDFFAVQDALASQLVVALAVDLTDEARAQLVRRHTEDLTALQLYWNGRFQWDLKTEAGFRRAIEFYEAAERRDPRFALPAAGLADAWAVLGVFNIMPPDEVYPRARAAATRAIDRDPQLADAHASLGHVLVQYDRNWTGGERYYRQALRLRPALAQAYMWLANLHVMQGRGDEAVVEGRQAQSLEPMSLSFAANVGMILYYQGDYDAAYEQLAGLYEAAPQAVLPRRHLARVLLLQGRVKEALELVEGFSAAGPGSMSDLGRAYALSGQRAAATAEIARIAAMGERGFGVEYDIAVIQAALGETDAALGALERAFGDHSQMMGFLNAEPGFRSIRGEPRFRAVSRRLGLA